MFSLPLILLFFFFFNDTATTEIYTLSLHDALPISVRYSEAIEVAELTPLRDRSRSAIEMICVQPPVTGIGNVQRVAFGVPADGIRAPEGSLERAGGPGVDHVDPSGVLRNGERRAVVTDVIGHRTNPEPSCAIATAVVEAHRAH